MKEKIIFAVEVGGRTKLGRTIKALLDSGTARVSAGACSAYDDAARQLAYEMFRAAYWAVRKRKRATRKGFQS